MKNIAQRRAVIEASIKSIEEARNNDTKSSAGDKFETGREMMQIEEDKMNRQLHEVNRVNLVLQKINPEQKYTKGAHGSLVTTNNGNYFLSVGIGKVILDKKIYYCISLKSPIGIKLLGKVVGDDIEFNGLNFQILEIN